MRIRLALLALAFAASPLAAKPTAVDDGTDPARARWRTQSVSLCVAQLNALDGITPDDSEAICGCAFDRYMPGRATDALPPLDPFRLRTEAGAPILSCTIEREPGRAGTVGRWLATIPPIAAPAAVPPPVLLPPDDSGKPGAADDTGGREGPGFDPGAWLSGLSWPRWLTDSGLPLWAWIPIVVIGLVLLRALFRREDGRDLIGPPPGSRPSSGPPRPRR